MRPEGSLKFDCNFAIIAKQTNCSVVLKEVGDASIDIDFFVDAGLSMLVQSVSS